MIKKNKSIPNFNVNYNISNIVADKFGLKKNKSIPNFNENYNISNIVDNKFGLEIKKQNLISYGEFIEKNPKATKKQRCNAIANFYKILLS